MTLRRNWKPLCMRDAGVHASGLTRLYKLNEVMATPSYIITYIHGVHYLEINVKLDTFQGTSPRLNQEDVRAGGLGFRQPPRHPRAVRHVHCRVPSRAGQETQLLRGLPQETEGHWSSDHER